MPVSNIASVYEMSPASEVFFERERFRAARWVGYSGLPANAIERAVPRPRLSRYRAALQTAWFARRHPGTAVISHLPAMTVATDAALRLTRAQAPHLAFAFNFTDLPTGAQRNRWRAAFSRVHRFTVFSQHEVGLYSDYFQLPAVRFDATRWTQAPPAIQMPSKLPFDGHYLCAIGGEDRDYPLLARVAREARIPVLIIGRPGSVSEADLGPQVRFLANQPHALTWGYALRSRGMVLPLKSPLSRCGQITLVSAALLGIPTLAANTAGLQEYLDETAPLRYEAGNRDELDHQMQALFENHETLRQQASERIAPSRQRYDRRHWTETVERQLAQL